MIVLDTQSQELNIFVYWSKNLQSLKTNIITHCNNNLIKYFRNQYCLCSKISKSFVVWVLPRRKLVNNAMYALLVMNASSVVSCNGALLGKLINARKKAAKVDTNPVKTTGSRPCLTSKCPRIPKHKPPIISPNPTKIPWRPKISVNF